MITTTAIILTSGAFNSNAPIPKKHTGEGKDVSPPLQWSGVPAEAQELALICDDPDAPRAEPWVHWVIYAIPASVHELPEGVPQTRKLDKPIQAFQGVNDFGKIGYGGPMPPRGHGDHHYHFKLFALDTPLNLQPGATSKQLMDAMKGHIISETTLTGTYERM